MRLLSLLTIVGTILIQSIAVASDRLEIEKSPIGFPRPLQVEQTSLVSETKTNQDHFNTADIDEKMNEHGELKQTSTTSGSESYPGQLQSNQDIKSVPVPIVDSRWTEESQELLITDEEENLYNQVSLSTRSDFPCPQADEIFPCTCFFDETYNIFLNCTNVESEEQLASVFQQEFPVKELYQFEMVENQAIKVLGNILNGVTFQRVYLFPGPFVLEGVSEYFLLDSLEVLTFLHIHGTNLNADLFPFSTLNFAKRLEQYIIDSTHFTWIPPIRAPMLTELSFDIASIIAVEPGTFDGVPNMQILEMQINVIEELKAGTFPIHEVPTLLKLYNNKIHSVEPGSFYLADTNSSASNAAITIDVSVNRIQTVLSETFFFRDGVMNVDLHNNQISLIEPRAFVLPSVTALLTIELSLHDNQLTTLDEEVFLDLMPYVSVISLYGNPLACECDIAWLVLTPELMAKVDEEATCEDGTNLHDLDPALFEAFC